MKVIFENVNLFIFDIFQKLFTFLHLEIFSDILSLIRWGMPYVIEKIVFQWKYRNSSSNEASPEVIKQEQHFHVLIIRVSIMFSSVSVL